jgi:hypothetical protein
MPSGSSTEVTADEPGDLADSPAGHHDVDGTTDDASSGGGRVRSRSWTWLLVAVVVLSGVGIALALHGRPIEQPIAFNHRLHVEDLGSDCTDCHLYAMNGVRATIPNIELCADCHAEAQSESAEEAKVVSYVESGEPIPWRKIYWVPDHVYFSHRRHVALGGIECETCHGPMAEAEEPMKRPFVKVTMNGCMDCHDQAGASNDCLLCHK